ncbi:hypothetical protein RZS08_02265, partial [Arthrospira platensis SPKY1]|nr:hypothetical protein [Arthrospira platensis SPKY1]
PKLGSQLTQVIQDSPLSFAISVNQVFKDKNGICWRYLGQFEYDYIAPPNVISITQSGDYFVGSSSILYANCSTCIQSPCVRPSNLIQNVLLQGIGGPLVPPSYLNFSAS